MHTSPQNHQPPYGGPYLPVSPRKTPWGRILLGVLAAGVALTALLIVIGSNAGPAFTPAQGKDVCALLVGGRSVDEVAEKVAPRYGWTVAEARRVAEEIERRGCGVKR